MDFNRTRNRPKEDGDKHIWCFQYFQDIRSAGLNKLEQEELSDNSSCKSTQEQFAWIAIALVFTNFS